MSKTTSAPAAAPKSPADAARAKLIKILENEALKKYPEYQDFSFRNSEVMAEGLVDYLFATTGDPSTPEAVFGRVRWGGQYIFLSTNVNEVTDVANKFTKGGFVIETKPSSVTYGLFGFKFPGLTRKLYYFAARKTLIIQPGTNTDRFTYQVELVKHPTAGWCVSKQIPDFDHVMWRIRERFPDAAPDIISKRARKLVDKIFPIFLTREAALLQILQRDLPKPYNEKLPKVIDIEKAKNGFVRKVHLGWLRCGGKTLTQLEFAKQATDLLRCLHDVVGVMHLDLRLDNVVITRSGVGFVDFGSAVRLNEDLSESQMLSQLFDEIMSTSQIQRTLGRMKESGRLTSRTIIDGYHKTDKAADLFYLALQWNDPHSNPDFKELVEHNPESPEAKELNKITETFLRPADPENPTLITATDLLTAIKKVEAALGKG